MKQPWTCQGTSRVTATGTPLAIRYDGRVWAVAAEPLHWFTRDSWWNSRGNAAVGSGDLVTTEHWRVQVGLIYPRVGFPATSVLN